MAGAITLPGPVFTSHRVRSLSYHNTVTGEAITARTVTTAAPTTHIRHVTTTATAAMDIIAVMVATAGATAA